MATELSIKILPSELAQVVESVFETMLRLEAKETEMTWSPSVNRLAAVVHLGGDWNGAVLLECDPEQACRFAGHFLSMKPPESVDDDVRDVLGELANMIGGNLKCALAPGIRLSMPSVVSGGDYSLRVCGAKAVEHLTFHCSEGLFHITVLTAPC